MASGGWYVVTYRKDPTSPFTVQVMQKPFPGPPATALADSGPYATKAEAEAAATKLKNEPIPGAPSGVNNVLGGGLAGIDAFFSTLGQANTWIRVAEVAIGVILIAVGVAKITRAVPIATKIAATASKAAVI